MASHHWRPVCGGQASTLASYVRAVVGDCKDRAGVLLLDANTPDSHKTEVFDRGLQESGFKVLSPSIGGYVTTRKQRSELHGQIYDTAKCMKTVQAHKTFAAMVQDAGSAPWEIRGNVRCVPDLRFEAQNLPSRAWPSDHSMLQIHVYSNSQGISCGRQSAGTIGIAMTTSM